MGGLKRMKSHVVPHIFDCQLDRKKSFINPPGEVTVIKTKHRIIDEAITSSPTIEDGVNLRYQ